MAYSADKLFKAIKVGRRYQQNNYELFPDWFHYDCHDYELIRHKIGYALFGIPNISKDASEGIPSTSKYMFHNTQRDNVFNNVVYSKEMCNVINIIYNKILKYGQDSSRNFICLGIIYNVIVLHEAVEKSEQSGNSTTNESNNIYMVPVFKLEKQQLVWYIDNGGRMYKSWKDYVTSNRLPKCTMIVPKCGFYQHDPCQKITECYSSVWLEVLDSPACSTVNKFLKGMDITASATSICATVGVGVASFLTPVAPIALATALVSGGVSGSWLFARNSHKLVDLAAHKQSISPIDKNAFPAWLGIGSSVLGIGASGGSLLLTKTVQEGIAISTAARIAYNSVVIGNATMNGIGMIYQGYCLIEKYNMNKEVDFLDVVALATNVLFFSNTVMNIKLAGQLIETSNGTIFERFKSALRSNRLIKEFNRSISGDAQNITYKTKEVSNTKGFLDVLYEMKDNFSMNYQGGNIVINNKVFIDPVMVVGSLLTGTIIKFGAEEYIETSNDLNSLNTFEEDIIMNKLKFLLTRLLRDFLSSHGFNQVEMPDVSHFYEILQEMKYSENAQNVLIKVFRIAVIILKYYHEPRKFLFDAVYFVWAYCKTNLKEYGISVVVKSGRKQLFHTLKQIVELLFECIDEIHKELFSAFHTYIYYTKGSF